MTSSSVLPSHPRPAPGEPREYNFPPFERATLGNGMRLVIAPVSKLPVVTLLAIVDAGAACDVAGQEGVARLAANLLSEGTTGSSGVELTDRFERLGAAFNSSADWDSAIATTTVLSSRLGEAMEIVGEVLMDPSFPEREVERLRNERTAELLQQRMEPRGLADDIFDRVLYAPESRYGRAAGGDERSVRSIIRDHITAFYAARYRPGATTLVIVGDVSVADAERMAQRTFGAWSGETPSAIRVDDRPRRTTRAVHVVPKPDAAQSELRLGHVGLSRLHPDFFPVSVMNALVGGLFSSRINLNLREKHGYTYGAHSAFDWRRGAGPFTVSAAVKSEVTHLAARETLGEIEKFRGERVPDRELALAVDYLAGVFPIRYETTLAIAGALAGTVVHALPDDYFDSYRDRVRAVTPASVQKAALEHLHLDRLQLLVVGDEGAVRPGLEELGFGPISVYDAEGELRG